MTGPVFVDTNVLVYAIDQADLRKQAAAAQWREALWSSGLGRLSFQVLQEFFVTVVRKSPAAAGLARREVRDLLAWKPVVVDSGVLERAWVLQDRYRIPFWDALVVAAAQVSACRYLLTEDLQDDQDLGGVRVISPFSLSPTDLP